MSLKVVDRGRVQRGVLAQISVEAPDQCGVRRQREADAFRPTVDAALASPGGEY